jgi:hypothetical protein
MLHSTYHPHHPHLSRFTPSGDFIMEYVGEVLGPSEFKHRVKQYAKEGQQHHYFMSLRTDEVNFHNQTGDVCIGIGVMPRPPHSMPCGWPRWPSYQPGERTIFNFVLL